MCGWTASRRRAAQRQALLTEVHRLVLGTGLQAYAFALPGMDNDWMIWLVTVDAKVTRSSGLCPTVQGRDTKVLLIGAAPAHMPRWKTRHRECAIALQKSPRYSEDEAEGAVST
jgi:hypothetical protein